MKKDNKKAPVAPECSSALATHSVGSKNPKLQAYTIKSEQELQAELEKELENKFTPKKQKSEKLSETYSEIASLSRSADADGCIKQTPTSKKFYRKSGRVLQCGSFLEFYQFPDKNKLHYANFCKDRLCPMCNWRRSMKIFSQLSDVIAEMKRRPEFKNSVFVFLTLTIRNMEGQDLNQAISDMLEGWRRLYNKNKAFKNGYILGSYRTMEITYNREKQTYHPHLHVILAVTPEYFKKGYISQDQWCNIWQSCMKLDYKPICFIEKTYRKNQSIIAEELEAAKYAAKDSDYLSSPEVTKIFSEALEGRQLVGFTGCFAKIRRDLGHDDAEDGDLVHTTNELETEVQFAIVRLQWKNGIYERKPE